MKLASFEAVVEALNVAGARFIVVGRIGGECSQLSEFHQ